jgi:spermidine synthase
VKQSPILWPQVYLSVALTTGATLLLELSLTRIFSVVFYYHMAFLAISIALFGLGAGGVFSYVVAGWKAPLFTKLGRLSALNSLLVVLALVMVLEQKTNPSDWNLVLIYFTTALPFFVSGTIVSLAVSETISRVNRVYFFDLLGAAGGCLLLIPLLRGFGGVSTVLGASITFATAAAIWHSMAESVRGRVASVALGLALVAFLAYNQQHHLIDIKYAKDQALAQEMFQKWNDFSRIGLIDRKDEGRYSIVIDADAATDIATFDLDHLTAAQRRDLMEQGQALPYVLRPGAKTLVIGPGGGYDVARALVTGSHDVTGVEINPIIATTIMRERFPDLSHGLYLRPDVHIEVEDGRSFVRRSTAKYQVIQATLVDTWASTAAGAFALSENNLYTVDAVRDYLQHLTPDGLVAFTRWGFKPPRESLRLLALAREALTQIGEPEAWRHVIVVRSGQAAGYGALDTVLISRKPFSTADVAGARALAASAHLEEVYAPDVAAAGNPFHDLLHSAQPDEYERAYRFDITPVTDNRPFFFYTVQPRDLLNFVRNASHNMEDYKVNEAVPLLFGLLGVSLLATLLILVLPPVLLGARLPRQQGVRGFLIFFLLIGAGYIFIEVGLIQKFVLFLGHPTYALTVVIFSMLLSSGLGSAMSKRLLQQNDVRLIKVLGLVALMAAALGLLTGWLLTVSVGLPLPLKALMTVVLLAPLGFLMGMPFPTGLKKLEEWHSPSVRWAWSLNAAASVLGSVGALVLAIYMGLVQTLIIGGMFYLAALAVVARARPSAVAAPQPGANRVVLAK